MIVFTCGATGGHVTPAIALAQELSDHNSVHFLTSSDRTDRDIVVQNRFKHTPLGPSPRRSWQYFFTFFKAFFALKKLNPSLIVSTGGGQTVPVLCVAILKKIPFVLLEQNVLPGRVNRLVARFARRIYTSFDESASYFNHPVRCLGNPIRSTFQEDTASQKYATLDFPDFPKIVCFGGSQGALLLNTIFKSQYAYFLQSPFVLIHITGKSFYNTHFKGSETLLSNQASQLKVVVFPYFEKMDLLYQQAHLMICRSGATTMAELLHFGTSAILVPFAQAKDNHQYLNASAFSTLEAGIMIEEKDLTFKKIQDHFKNPKPNHSRPNKAAWTISQDILHLKSHG